MPRERRGEKARRYGGVLICRRRASRRHCRAKSIGLRLRNDSRNTGSDSGIPVATVFQADKFSTGHTIDRRKRKRCPFDSFSFHSWIHEYNMFLRTRVSFQIVSTMKFAIFFDNWKIEFLNEARLKLIVNLWNKYRQFLRIIFIGKIRACFKIKLFESN